MGLRRALRSRLRTTLMFEYTLGAAVVVIIVIYLVYALMRPENF